MLFHPHQRKCRAVNIYIDDCIISQVDSVKFLGLYIDSHIDWKIHINNLCSRVAKLIGVLYRLKYYVPTDVLKTIYNSIIYSHFTYCNIVWGNTHSTILNKLNILQNKALRIISNSDRTIHTRFLLVQLNELNLFDIYRFQAGQFMYKIFNNLIPHIISNYFILNSDVFDRNTRHSNNFHCGVVKTSAYQRSILSSGPNIWNNLTLMIRDSKSLPIFKRNFKHILLSKYM